MNPEQQDIFDNVVVRARELKARRRYREALALLKKAIAESPSNLKLKASLADLYYRTERFREALALAGEMLRDDPNDPRALVVVGNVLLERKKPREALEYFRLSLKVAETDYLWQRIARGHLDNKEPQAALAALVRAEALAPDSRDLLRLLAEDARMLDDPATEREVLRRASKVAPKDPEDYAGFLLYLLQDLPSRRAALASERARETPGQEMNPHLLLFESECLIKARDFAAARTRLATLLSRQPSERIRLAAQTLERQLEKKRKR